MKRSGTVFSFFLLLLLAIGCQDQATSDPGENPETDASSEPVRGDWIRVYNPSDPDGIHPYATTHAAATYVKDEVFQYLYDFDPVAMKSVPLLANDMADISEDGLNFTFEIRKEAKWDNGDPITGEDYAFSMKCIKNPLSKAAHLVPYFSFVKDVVVDADNPRRFTVITDKPFFLAETAVAGIEVISKNFYDANNLLGQYRVLDFYERPNEMAEEEDVIAFSDHFFSEKFRREPEFIYGSGPYKLVNWTTGDNITLERKQDWWCDQLDTDIYGTKAYPEKIIFKTITDRSAALLAAGAGELDLLHGVTGDDFKKAKEENEQLKSNFDFYTPETYSTTFFAFNNRPPVDRTPFFADKRVRKAIHHLVDVPKVIENVYGGFGVQAMGPIHPTQASEYKSDMAPIPFDPAKAAELLDEAGWIDSDGDGIRDKIIKGKKVDFEFEFMVSNSSKTAPRAANMLANEAEKVGIKLNLNKVEFRVMTGRMMEHEFDMVGSGFSAGPIPTDLMQVWHTEGWVNRGSNYMGFGNAYTDSLILAIRATIDPADRTPLYYEFQEIVREEVPAVFIMHPQEKILIHKRFRGYHPTVVRPGFKPKSYWVPKSEQKF